MLLITALLTALLPTIWIVDAANGPGANFTDLPAAIAAAQSGDTIIVRQGNYTHFAVSGKALTIRGDGSGTTTILRENVSPSSAHGSTIDAVPAGSAFYVDGVTIAYQQLSSSVPPPGSPTLRITGAGSQVVLADVFAGGASLTDGGPAVAVVSGAVHAARSTFQGGIGVGQTLLGGLGGPGVLVLNGGAFSADSCSFTGGFPLFTGTLGPNHGGNGITVTGGSATISRSSLHGAASSSGFGGHGVVVTQSGFARLVGTAANEIRGGSGGSLASAGSSIVTDATSSALVHGPVLLAAGSPNVPVTVGSVTTGLTPLPSIAVAGNAHASGEVFANQLVAVTLHGLVPGGQFVFGFNVVTDYSTAFAPTLLGELFLSTAGLVTVTGTLDGAGDFTFWFHPLNDVPSVLNVPLYAQLAVLDPSTSQFLASGLDVHLYRN